MSNPTVKRPTMTSAANTTGTAVTPLSALAVPVVPPVERPAVQIPTDSDNHLKRKADADEIENETDDELNSSELNKKYEELLTRHRSLRKWCAQTEVANTRRLSILESDLKATQKALSDAKDKIAEQTMKIVGLDTREKTDRRDLQALTERVDELEKEEGAGSNDAVLERIDKLTTLFNAVLAANAANVAAVAEAHNSVLTAYKSVFPTKSPKSAPKGK